MLQIGKNSKRNAMKKQLIKLFPIIILSLLLGSFAFAEDPNDGKGGGAQDEGPMLESTSDEEPEDGKGGSRYGAEQQVADFNDGKGGGVQDEGPQLVSSNDEEPEDGKGGSRYGALQQIADFNDGKGGNVEDEGEGPRLASSTEEEKPTDESEEADPKSKLEKLINGKVYAVPLKNEEPDLDKDGEEDGSGLFFNTPSLPEELTTPHGELARSYDDYEGDPIMRESFCNEMAIAAMTDLEDSDLCDGVGMIWNNDRYDYTEGQYDLDPDTADEESMPIDASDVIDV
jgi:hypothetical protein